MEKEAPSPISFFFMQFSGFFCQIYCHSPFGVGAPRAPPPRNARSATNGGCGKSSSLDMFFFPIRRKTPLAAPLNSASEVSYFVLFTCHCFFVFCYFFQDLYRKLLEAESEGILDNVDMLEVEKLILGPESG